ncbi:unnamed protein product [Musa acuminata var. zebrina]
MIGRGKLLSGGYMRKSFRDSLKLLEADIGHANTLNSRSQSCPFCRDSLRDLWVFVNSRDVVDMTMVTREDIRRLIMYIKKLPEVVPETVFDACDSHDRLPMCPRHLVDFHQFLNLVSICSSSLILSIVWR